MTTIGDGAGAAGCGRAGGRGGAGSGALSTVRVTGPNAVTSLPAASTTFDGDRVRPVGQRSRVERNGRPGRRRARAPEAELVRIAAGEHVAAAGVADLHRRPRVTVDLGEHPVHAAAAVGRPQRQRGGAAQDLGAREIALHALDLRRVGVVQHDARGPQREPRAAERDARARAAAVQPRRQLGRAQAGAAHTGPRAVVRRHVGPHEAAAAVDRRSEDRVPVPAADP